MTSLPKLKSLLDSLTNYEKHKKSNMLDYTSHFNYSEKMENKGDWFKLFNRNTVDLNVGIELASDGIEVTTERKDILLNKLLLDFKEKRFLNKSPTSSFFIEHIYS